jgi:uncharacterized protein
MSSPPARQRDVGQDPPRLARGREPPAPDIPSPGRRSPRAFVLLVFGLSAPFWLMGAVTRSQLLPGLPVSALAAACPLLAAAILVGREGGTTRVVALLMRSFDYGRIRSKVWYAPIVLLTPMTAVSAYGVMRLRGEPLPRPGVSLSEALVLLLTFFVGALAEELGWSGYLIDPLQDRWDALRASLLLGLVWALWHLVPLMQADRAPAWIAWWCVSTVALRILCTWLYNNTGKSVFAVTLFHAMSNLSWQLFPNHGSHFDPRLTGLIMAFTAAAVAAVWGPRTLVRGGGEGSGAESTNVGV